MAEPLTVSLFQFDMVWKSPSSNLEILNQWLERIPDNTDLVVLPEMFLTGFSMDILDIAQPMDGEGVEWLKSVASSRNIVVMGSLAIKEVNQVYNRMLIAYPDGQLQWYNKRHLFRMGNEHRHFSQGDKLIVIKYKEWNIMPLVCYDLRFPVWSRNVDLKYDLLIYVANWPAVRRDAYITLLKARAIENQCYVVGVNRTGTDGNGINYSGDSVVVDYKGQFMTDLTETPGIINCTLSLEELRKFRKNFPAYLDADSFEIK